MRYTIMLLLVLAGTLVMLSGCNKPPAQPVEMSPASEPEYTSDKPRLTEIRPVDEGVAEDDDPRGETTPTLSEAAQGRTYVVQKGDTYWKIATTQLGNGHRWKEIETLNPGVNMNALKVGQTIRIPAK
ncbi:MAG: LysM peptidoglycan-binding domain-containing protein [Phycisphaerae bacterium]|nr:LysM peptidoglycan-binding domain-containing protein [Phycisphaerae bacterium]